MPFLYVSSTFLGSLLPGHLQLLKSQVYLWVLSSSFSTLSFPLAVSGSPGSGETPEQGTLLSAQGLVSHSH